MRESLANSEAAREREGRAECRQLQSASPNRTNRGNANGRGDIAANPIPATIIRTYFGAHLRIVRYRWYRSPATTVIFAPRVDGGRGPPLARVRIQAWRPKGLAKAAPGRRRNDQGDPCHSSH